MSSFSLGSLTYTLGLVLIIWDRSVYSLVPLWSLGSLLPSLELVGFIRGRWVHSLFLGLMGSSCAFVLAHARPGRVMVHPGSLGSLARLGFGVIGGRWFTCACPRGLWVNPGSLVHSRTPSVSLGSSGAVLFTHAHPGRRWFHPGWLGSYDRGRCFHSESLSSLAHTPELVGFIWVRLVRLRAPWWS